MESFNARTNLFPACTDYAQVNEVPYDDELVEHKKRKLSEPKRTPSEQNGIKITLNENEEFEETIVDDDSDEASILENTIVDDGNEESELKLFFGKGEKEEKEEITEVPNLSEKEQQDIKDYLQVEISTEELNNP